MYIAVQIHYIFKTCTNICTQYICRLLKIFPTKCKLFFFVSSIRSLKRIVPISTPAIKISCLSIDLHEGNRELGVIIDTVLAPHVNATGTGRAIMNKEHDRDKQITRERFLGGD